MTQQLPLENLHQLPPTQSFSRTLDADPLPVALKASGARVVPNHGFRMMDEDGQAAYLVVGTDFQSRELLERSM